MAFKLPDFQVYVDGALSEPLPVELGVPQGSILGPLLYTIYTNDLPEVIHQHDPPISLQEPQSAYNYPCKACGGLCCFADDSTLSISNKDPATLERNMNTKYKDIANYMSMNRLALNTDKTHLLIMASAQQHKKHGNFGIVLNTGAELITPSDSKRLLGAQVSNNFLWNEHVFGNEKSMVKMITSRINALLKISWSADFKTLILVTAAQSRTSGMAQAPWSQPPCRKTAYSMNPSTLLGKLQSHSVVMPSLPLH